MCSNIQSAIRPLQHTFQQLTYWLLQHQALWRSSPFVDSANPKPAWAEHYPSLWHSLTALPLDKVEHLKGSDSRLLKVLGVVQPSLNYQRYFCHQTLVKPAKGNEKSLLSNQLATGMPGNKRHQVESFVSELTPSDARQWIEWCAGKGYLGRLLTQSNSNPVTSLEWQQSLVDSGQHFADQHQLPMQFIQQDVFKDDSHRHIDSQCHCVALHACGDLHVRLLDVAVNKRAASLSIAPCCFHLIRGERYTPLSTLGQYHDLMLSKPDLRVPLQQTVTGGARVVRHRQLEMQYRLGFDELLRRELGFSEHTPVPSIKKSTLENGFEAFCLWAADKKSIALPKQVDLALFERLGEQRFVKMEQLSLAQQLFQRPLEMWLALDKCLYLQEQGYQVELKEFCEASLTPRNLLINASL